MASRDVKDFLYHWCKNHNYDAPVYSQPYQVVTSRNQKGAVTSKDFVGEVKITQLDGHVGKASARNMRNAKTAAAMDLCESLFKAGLMTEDEILSREPAKLANNKRPASDTAESNEATSNSQNDGPTTSKRMRVEARSESTKESPESPTGPPESPQEPVRIKEEEEDSEVEIIKEVVKAERNSKSEEDLLRQLHSDIWEHYCRNKQTPAIYAKKMLIVEQLSACLNQKFQFPFYLFPVGSTVNGLGSYNCDMDMCLVIYDRHYNGEEFINDSKNFAKHWLNSTNKALRKLTNVKNLLVIPAKVPIARFTYEDQSFSLEIDINCNNVCGIRNSHLLHYYAKVDQRFPALSLVIKHWAINAGVNDASQGSLSSYALILMVIHYLQYGLLQTHSYTKPILPNLQALFPFYFTSNSDVRQLKLDQVLPLTKVGESISDRLSLGELLLGFFNYYANYFNFARWAISIRLAQVIPKADILWSCQNHLIYIEEPFEGMNVARAVCTNAMTTKILAAFDSAYKNLKRNLTVESIGVIFPVKAD